MTRPYCFTQHNPGEQCATVLIEPQKPVFSKLFGDPSKWEWHSNKKPTKLERAQAYALEVRKRKFQVKRLDKETSIASPK